MLASMRLCANVPGQLAIQTALGGYQSIDDLVGAGRPPAPPARPRLRAAHRDSRASPCVKPKAALYMFPRLDPKLYPIARRPAVRLELLAEEKVLIVQGTGFNWPRPTTSASSSCRTPTTCARRSGRIAPLPRALPQAPLATSISH